MRFFVAVNGYRSSTSHGFGNTWQVMECKDRKHQRGILTEGLVVRDVQSILDDGSRWPVRSTMGIRIATASEIREAKKQEEHGHPIPMAEPYRNAEFELVRS